MGAFLGVAAGQRAAAEVHPPHVHAGRAAVARRWRSSARGSPSTPAASTSRRADGMLRMKDDMSGAAAVLGIMRALPALKPRGRGPRPDRGHREHALGLGHPPRRRAAGHERDHDRDRQHRRRGPADPGRRASATRIQKINADEIIDMATLTGACVVALGPLVLRPVRQRPGPGRPPAGRRRRGRRAGVAAAAASTSTARTSRARWPT